MEQNRKYLTIGAVMVALAAVIGISAVSFASVDNSAESQGKALAPRPWQDNGNWQGKKANFTGNQEARAEMQAKMEKIRIALENNDYQAYLQAVADTPMAQEIAEESFPRLLEAHKLAEEGRSKLEQSRNIREELGLKFGPGKGQGFGQGKMRGPKAGCPFAEAKANQ